MKLQISDFSDLLQVPLMFEIVHSADEAVEKLASAWPPLRGMKQRLLFISGVSGQTAGFARAYAAAFANAKVDHDALHYQVRGASMADVREIDAICAGNGVTTLIAVGGGGVIDTAKMVVGLRHLALIVVPTALSSDGVASPISVLTMEDGTRESLPSGVPSCVLVDLSITTRAPMHLTLAGVGDVASNASALLDAQMYEREHKGHVNGFSKILSNAAYHLIIDFELEDLTSFRGHALLAKGLILSGLAMAFAGNSLPCSGAEHLISHAIDHLCATGATHGGQVALSTIYCSHLRSVLGEADVEPALLAMIRRLGLPACPEDIGVGKADFLRAVQMAPTIRRNRFTVLHGAIPEGSLEKAYRLAFYN